jgi:hypothetical protein
MIQPRELMDYLLQYEQQKELVDRQSLYSVLCRVVDEGVITCLIFSCLEKEHGKNDIVLDFFGTRFFYSGKKTINKSVNKAFKIIEGLRALGLKVNVLPILDDTDPKRIWCWETSQDELTFMCELMVEQAKTSMLLPVNWYPTVWTALESKYVGEQTFASVLEWARSPGKHKIEIQKHKKMLAEHLDQYHFSSGLEETAVRRVASPVFEGVVLEKVLPNAILFQTEYPWAQKDILYQLLRNKNNPLAIIHPFVH